MKGQIATSFSTAARAATLAGKLTYGAKDWAGLTLLSTSLTSHLRAGAQRPARFPHFGRRNSFVERRNGTDFLIANPKPNRQIGSAYSQFNLLQKLRFRLQDRLELTANLQFSTSSNVPRYDNLIEQRGIIPRWARWDYGPQTRALAAVQLRDRRATRLYDVATYLISHQFIAEDRIARRFNDPLEEHNLEDVNTTNLQTDFSKMLGPQFTLRYGLDGRYDVVASTAFLRHVDTGEESVGLPTRYPSAGSTLASAGAYLEGQGQLSPRWQLRGGLRLSRQRLRAKFGADDPVDWPQVYLAGISNTESALTVSLGLQQEQGWRLLYAQGFRAPNIDDFAKFRERNGFIQVPNVALQPERSHTLEAAYVFRDYRLFGRRFNAELTGYHTWLRGAIARQAGTLPGGADFFISRGDTLHVQTNVNANRARVWGVDAIVRYDLTDRLKLQTDFHYLHGRRQQRAPDGNLLTLPQDHIPPAYGATALSWEKDGVAFGLRLRYQLAKQVTDYAVGSISGSAATGYVFDRSGTSDNLELTPRLAEGGTYAGAYGWWTANLWGEWSPAPTWTVRFKVDNLLDRHYRTFASG
ncbi:MAG: TonB-dependent receptor, partial [Bacteroidota bacterium]